MGETKGYSEGLVSSGFTLGILSIIFAGWIGIIVAAVGFSLCFSQQKKKKTRLGKVGVILNGVGFFISVAFLILYNTVLAPILQGMIG